MNQINMKYELVLGMEIHMQLKTDSKMFCGCKNDPFFSEPNANVCPICLGLPGALPAPNLEAIKSAQLMAYHLGSNLNSEIIFERKNYFYPDLPKGYQLTCPHWPISNGGSFIYDLQKDFQPKRWREVHLEEDTAKSTHTGSETLIDFNKSGVPLLEMVTEPDFHDIESAVEFCREVQLLARYLGVSEADMEKGQMRLEANISVRPAGQNDLPNYRVELKNINSFAFMRKALEFEFVRQSELLQMGEKLFQETRGFNENTGKTFSQRSKEEANDYRYFPEPDIPKIEVDEGWIREITSKKVETPRSIRSALAKHNLSVQYVVRLVNDFSLRSKFDKLISLGADAAKAANWIINKSEYNEKTAEEILEIENAKKSELMSDDSQLGPIINRVISENEKAVTDYKNGNTNSLQFLIGQVMKLSRGKADATTVRTNLLTKLELL